MPIDTGMSDREGLAVKSVEATGSQPPLHGVVSDSKRQQLPPPDHAVLPVRELRQRPSSHLTRPLQPPVPPIPTGACPSFRCHMDP
jgi:hypothetical protein